VLCVLDIDDVPKVKDADGDHTERLIVVVSVAVGVGVGGGVIVAVVVRDSEKDNDGEDEWDNVAVSVKFSPSHRNPSVAVVRPSHTCHVPFAPSSTSAFPPFGATADAQLQYRPALQVPFVENVTLCRIHDQSPTPKALFITSIAPR
jgi:hypothetical protein